MALWVSPRPGIQVILSAYNMQAYLGACLLSIEASLRGYDWILCLVDDGSNDKTTSILGKYQSRSATKVIYKRCPKSSTAAQAKNNAIKLGLPYRHSHPVICLMDADDVMTPARIGHLLPELVRRDCLAIAGDHRRMGSGFNDHLLDFRVKPNAPIICHFGPWALLFHSSLIPSNGCLFDESFPTMEDAALYNVWLARGVIIQPHSGQIVHIYRRRSGSVFNIQQNVLQTYHKLLDAQRYQLFHGKKIDVPLPSRLTVCLFVPHSTDTDTKHLYKHINHFNKYSELRFLYLFSNDHIQDKLSKKYSKEIACGVIDGTFASTEEEALKTLRREIKTNQFIFTDYTETVSEALIETLLNGKLTGQRGNIQYGVV